MPPARSKARKRALDILFEADQRDSPVLDLLAERIALGSPPVSAYAADLVRGVTEHAARIDELISQYAEGWTLDRMPAVDRNVLRIGGYELLWADDVPDAVAINEAVLLAQDLSTDASPAFVNGLLARIAELKPSLQPGPRGPRRTITQVTAAVVEPAIDEAGRLAVLRARLVAPMPDDRPWGWLGPLLVTAFGTFLRFNRLQVPRALIFDETYYVKDAWSILKHGVEWKLLDSKVANPMIVAGHTNIFPPCNGTSACGEYVVQPEVGKLLIAGGEWIFGLNPFGWRFASAVFGSLAILLICRIARRMTRSTLLGCIAGLLMSLDGLEVVLSRTGILDIFLMFFVLAAFGCILIDRDVSRARLAELVARNPGHPGGPRLGLRKWQLAAGVFLGLAVATKWNAAWYIVGFAALFLAWEIGARRTAGLKSSVRGGLRETVWLPLTFIAVPLTVYLASWSGWFATSTGYDRDYAQAHGVHTPVI